MSAIPILTHGPSRFSVRFIPRLLPRASTPRTFISTPFRFKTENPHTSSPISKLDPKSKPKPNSPPNPNPNTGRSGPHPLAVFAVITIGLAGYYVFVNNRDGLKKINGAMEEKGKQTNTSLATFSPGDVTVIFVLGGPGAGKGTQCENIVRDYGFAHLSAGDLLREEMGRPGSQYGEMIKTIMKEGKIVPMEVTIALLENAMKAAITTSGTKRFLIDGFPRELDQALKFEEIVVPSRFVLYFECPEEVMLKRLLKRGETSGRVDDNIETIKKRFKTFIDQSFPVIQYYEKSNKVYTVSCQNTPDIVYTNTKKIFNDVFTENK